MKIYHNFKLTVRVQVSIFSVKNVYSKLVTTTNLLAKDHYCIKILNPE